MTDRDLNGAGVPESTWRARRLPDRLPTLDLTAMMQSCGRAVVLAPHPDDEILGCGGTLSQLCAAGMEVLVIAITDGEASHPGRGDWLRTQRAGERSAALQRLGLTANVVRLGLPDGAVDAQVVADRVGHLLASDDLVFTPWECDGHPDHDAVGTATALLSDAHWSYLVWTWHWASVDAVPWGRAVRVPLDDAVWAAKRHAVGAFTSQLAGPAPILPAHVLSRLLRHDEVLLSPPNRSGSAAQNGTHLTDKRTASSAARCGVGG